MGTKRIFHMHEIAMAIRCMKKYEYGVVRNWEPAVPSEIIRLGAMFHELVNPKLTERTPLVADDELLFLQAFDIVGRYLTYNPLPDDILHAEESLLVPLDDDTLISLRPDLVYRTSGVIVVRDYKTMDRLPSPDDRAEDDLDFQVNVYLWGIQKLYPNYPVVFEYEFIRRAIPRDPELTREGRVSRAKIITTRERYAGALIRNGELTDGNSYLDGLPTEAEFFARQRLIKSGNELAAFERELLRAVQSIRLHENSSLYTRSVIKTGGEKCSSCPFFTVCVRELFNGEESDVTTMHLAGYRQRKKEEVNA